MGEAVVNMRRVDMIKFIFQTIAITIVILFSMQCSRPSGSSSDTDGASFEQTGLTWDDLEADHFAPWQGGREMRVTTDPASPNHHQELVVLPNGEKVRNKMHHAWDFSMDVGTPLLASAPGKVRRIQNNPNAPIACKPETQPGCEDLANYVIIQWSLPAPDGKKIESQYLHLSRVTVQEGQPVTHGTLIGYSGNTGWSTGPHLHYQVQYTPGNGSYFGTSIPMKFAELSQGSVRVSNGAKYIASMNSASGSSAPEAESPKPGPVEEEESPPVTPIVEEQSPAPGPTPQLPEDPTPLPVPEAHVCAKYPAKSGIVNWWVKLHGDAEDIAGNSLGHAEVFVKALDSQGHAVAYWEAAVIGEQAYAGADPANIKFISNCIVTKIKQ